MEAKLIRQLLFVVSGLAMLSSFCNCDHVKLDLVGIQHLSKAAGQLCAAPPKSQKLSTKILIVLDESGSNVEGNASGPATDPTKSFRYGLVDDFLNKNAGNSQLYYSIIVFNQDTARALTFGSSQADPIFTNDLTTVHAALDQFKAEPDQGMTPYRSALSMARAAIAKDTQANTGNVAVMYDVVLISDGYPTDYSNPIDDTAIDLDVKALVQSSAKVTLSTVYYGPVDDSASGRLARMAKEAGGQFSNVNVDGKIPLDKLISLNFSEPWMIKRFVVSNMNAAPCDDGTMGADSDADGICDKDEIAYNNLWLKDPNYAAFASRMGGTPFDPLNRNSFSPVYNDLVYLKYITQGVAIDPSCTDTSDDDHDLLNVCEEAFVKSTSPSGPTPDWTTKMGKDSDPKNFDSNGNGFLDGLEFIFNRGGNGGLDYNAGANLLIDGFRMDQIILQHRNPKNPSASVAYDGSFLFTGVNQDGQNCFSYKQTVLPLYQVKGVTKEQVSGLTDLVHGDDESVILIYFIQTPASDPNGPGELHYTYKKMKFGQSALDLNLTIDDFTVVSADQARIAPPPTAK